MIYGNGSKYEGEFENGHRKGKGKGILTSKELYIEGQFENDNQFDGYGVKFLSDKGMKYEGQFKNSEFHG